MKYELIFNNNVNNKTMKTKHFLALSLVLATAISALQAQVRIGDLSAPRSGVSLDLNIKGDTAQTALGLPRVKLMDITNPLPIADNFAVLNGAMVYNYSAENGVDVGIYFAGENSWVKLLAGSDATADKDITLLDPLPATVWLGGSAPQPRQQTVTTSIDSDPESSLSYRWYYLDTDGIPVATDSTAKTFSISNGSAAHQLTSAGEVKKYFCVVKNGSKSAVTTRIRAVYGSGVFLNNDKWLNVLGYNLGVSNEGKLLTPAEQFSKDSRDAIVAGYLYQWGRDEDDHQLRDTTQKSVSQFLYHGVLSATDGITVNSTTGQVDDNGIKGRFILRDAGTLDWRNYTAAVWESAYDPCSKVNDGNKTWRLPTSSEWSQIYTNNYPENTGKGLRFRPDGTNISVFLPAGGDRGRANGVLYNAGAHGHYWSSTPTGNNAFDLFFTATAIYPVNSNPRAGGSSVRCVSE
jgi:hypothetical protein